MGFNKKTHLTIRIVQKTSPSLSEKQTNVKKYSPSRKKENNNSHYQMRVYMTTSMENAGNGVKKSTKWAHQQLSARF